MSEIRKKQSFSEKLVTLWYQPVLSRWLWPLLPFSLLVKAISASRYKAWNSGKKPSQHCRVPVIVVGNITVGGSGKTPLVTTLVAYLKAKGWSPAIISRGYGAQCKDFPARVYPDSDPAVYGDEPVMLAKMTETPLIIDPDRPQAAHMACDDMQCDIIISDDGLQHYPLNRNIEIAVVDGVRGLGNQHCLPAGPLRESVSRLNTVDLIVSKGDLAKTLNRPYYAMNLVPDTVENITSGDRLTLSEFVGRYDRVHAVAGIGHPTPFFKTLRDAGLEVIEHIFSDHHPYQPSELLFCDDHPVMMTVKDAVKCRNFGRKNTWCLSIEGVLSLDFWQALDVLLHEKCTHKQ